MFDHVKFGVSDYAASKAFFLQALAPLGVTLAGEGEPAYGAELAGANDASLCLYQSEDKPAPLHIAFAPTAASRLTPSGTRRWPPEARITARRGCGLITTPITTPPLSLRQTDTISKRCVIWRPEQSLSLREDPHIIRGQRQVTMFGITQGRAVGADGKVIALGAEQIFPPIAEVHAGQQRKFQLLSCGEQSRRSRSTRITAVAG